MICMYAITVSKGNVLGVQIVNTWTFDSLPWLVSHMHHKGEHRI